MNRMYFYALLALLLPCATTASATTVISDDFEVDSSGSYTLRDDGNSPSGDGFADSTSTFAFDYVAAGIPLAPNSAPGDVGGLRLTANDTAGDGGAAANAEEDHITAFHNTSVYSQAFTLTVDVWMGVESAGGSTEFMHVGVGGNSNDFTSIFTPVVFNGHTLAVTGEGGSASDYRHSDNDEIFNTGDLTYLNSTNTTNATGDTYQAIFAGGDFPGSPGNRWTTLEVRSSGTNLTYSFDGTPIISTPFDPSGTKISLGYADLFDSVGPHFVIYDNLSVTVPEPTAMALLSLGGVALLRRRR